MNNKVQIVAEAGVNHNGDIQLAKKLVDVAVQAGADAVKFQTFKAESLAVQTARKAEYQLKHTPNKLTQFEMLRELELSDAEFIELFQYCGMKHIQFLSSPFDMESIDFLDKLGVDTIKIPSGEITNYFYLQKIAGLNKKIILSTGMATVEEIEAALTILNQNSNEIILLHCTSAYPVLMEDVNLRAMNTLEQIFHKKVGFSDHTLGMEASIAAVALGACIIEKHITLDKSSAGPDHEMSLEPDEFKKLVKGVRNIEKALGYGKKTPTDQELRNREFVRKSIVAARDIVQGELFTEENLCTKRAGQGISPMRLNEFIGNKATRSYRKEEKIDE